MYIGYDFTPLVDTFEKLFELYRNPNEANYGIENRSTTDDMYLIRDIKNELNKFFKDSFCTDLIITGADTGFFGIKVYPFIGSMTAGDIIFTEESVRFNEYRVEIDKKLITYLPLMESSELMALLINEVGRVVNDNTPASLCRGYIAKYLLSGNVVLKKCNDIMSILAFGMVDYVSKYNSLFYVTMDDMPDYMKCVNIDFTNAYGLTKKIESAIPKINNSGLRTYNGNNNDTASIVFNWSINLYLNFKYKRIAALKVVENCMKLSNSVYERRNYRLLEDLVRTVDDSKLIYEGVMDAAKSKMRKMRGNTIKSLADDYYEIAMQARNVEDEDDALYLMRQINSRMSILGEYLEGDLNQPDRVECQTAYEKYAKIREDLAKTQTYKRSTTAIYVNYPVIQDKRFS